MPLFAVRAAVRCSAAGLWVESAGEHPEHCFNTVTSHRHNWQPVTRSRVSRAVIVLEAISYKWENLFLGHFRLKENQQLIPKWYNSFYYYPNIFFK
jgi:hypothetical protein